MRLRPPLPLLPPWNGGSGPSPAPSSATPRSVRAHLFPPFTAPPPEPPQPNRSLKERRGSGQAWRRAHRPPPPRALPPCQGASGRTPRSSSSPRVPRPARTRSASGSSTRQTVARPAGSSASAAGPRWRVFCPRNTPAAAAHAPTPSSRSSPHTRSAAPTPGYRQDLPYAVRCVLLLPAWAAVPDAHWLAAALSLSATRRAYAEALAAHAQQPGGGAAAGAAQQQPGGAGGQRALTLEQRAVTEITVERGRPKVVKVIAAAGSGKSTCLRVLAMRLVRPMRRAANSRSTRSPCCAARSAAG